ncbi:hypothetical protein J6590_107653 [Homalodisca vitripennis]|nr:hypothetical protein J6590_107653 [Homalodisca vitripennis]
MPVAVVSRDLQRRLGCYSRSLPPIVLLMISSSQRIYNRDRWIAFTAECQEKNVPIELVIYHEDMLNGTVREPMNLLSRFRPFPDLFGKPILKLSNSHGSLNFTQIYLRMLKYACDIPYATTCIVLTERSIPVRSPVTLYRRALRSRCYLNISYNVIYGPMRSSVKGRRSKPFAAVNNICQGLYTVHMIRPPGETHYNKKRAETPTAWLKSYRGDGNVGQLRCIPVYIQLGSLPRPQLRLPPLSFQGIYTT